MSQLISMGQQDLILTGNSIACERMKMATKVLNDRLAKIRESRDKKMKEMEKALEFSPIAPVIMKYIDQKTLDLI